MKGKSLKDIIVSEKASIKEVMRVIDHSGLRVTYAVDDNNKLVGSVSDSDVRRAILAGKDIKQPVRDILNEDPVVLSLKDIKSNYAARKKIKILMDRMPGSSHILVIDKDERPLKLMPVLDLVQSRRKETMDVSQNGVVKVLVVGGAGFLGSVLVRRLLTRGFQVRALDILMYGIESIEELLSDKNFELIEGDMRNISVLGRSLEGVDVVINLAAIVGDPACKNKPEDTIQTNFLANKILAEACKYNQINRFIYASTCSVYGNMAGADKLSESSPLNPVSLYARSKIQSEEGILALEDENFSPTILRMSTLYGYSPRMRFDLVVNTMTKTAVVNGRISVHGGGKQWRPLLNVDDAADAYVKCLEAPLKKVKGEIFNVGSSNLNYQIIKIAETVKKCVPQAEMMIEGESADPRDYFVDFSKIERSLKYKANSGLERSISDIKNAIETGGIKDVDDPKYYNVEMNQ